MTERAPDLAELLNPDEQEPQNEPDKRVLAPVISVVSMAMRDTKTFFEAGAREDIRQHHENGGVSLLLVSHFSRAEPFVLAQSVRANDVLNHLQYNTGITARRAMLEMPGFGYIVRHSGGEPVDRAIEHPNETPEQKAVRQDDNQK